MRSPYRPGRLRSRILPGTGGSCWGWGFFPPTSGSAWKDTREVTAARDLREAAPRSRTEGKLRPRRRWGLAKASQGVGGSEQGSEGDSCGIPGTPWGPEYLPPRHRAPLPVPVDATVAQDREQGQGGEDQDEHQDPRGQNFQAAGKEKRTLASGEGQSWRLRRGEEARPAQCPQTLLRAPEAHCLGVQSGRGGQT